MTIDMNDPWAVASNPAPREYYGQVDADAKFVFMKKGQTKAVFNPEIHDIQNRSVEISITLTMLEEMQMSRPIVRDTMDWEKEWALFTLPSMKACNINSGQELNGRWVKAVLINTREVPTASGSMFQKTALKFLAVYADESACRADYLKVHSQQHSVGEAGATAPAPDDAGKGKATASMFLAALLKPEIAGATTPAQATARAGLVIEKNALLAKYFTLHSPEVAAAVAAKFGEQAPVAAPDDFAKYPQNMAKHTAVEQAAIANALAPVAEFDPFFTAI